VNISFFSLVNNVELKPFQGAQIVRSAGTSCVIIGKQKQKIILKLSSGWQLFVSVNCIGSVGSVSNNLYKFKDLKKAGKNRA